MALLNYLYPGTYSTAAIKGYSKRDGSVDVELTVWDSQEKSKIVTVLIFRSEKFIEQEMQVLISDEQLKTSALVDGNIYMSTVDISLEPWTGIYYKPQQWVSSIGAFGWTDSTTIGHVFALSRKAFKDKVTNKWYTENNPPEVSEDAIYVPDAWNRFFSIESQLASGNNLIKNAYLFLKEMPQFANLEDG